MRDSFMIGAVHMPPPQERWLWETTLVGDGGCKPPRLLLKWAADEGFNPPNWRQNLFVYNSVLMCYSATIDGTIQYGVLLSGGQCSSTGVLVHPLGAPASRLF